MSYNPDDFIEYGKHQLPSHGTVWEFSQMFGEGDEPEANELPTTDNWISSLKFDPSGKYLAVGYNCGQVVILYQQEEQTYQLFTEFKSHDSEFDCLTSTEIEEKINVIEWFPFHSNRLQFMTCNDKTIKLFKMGVRFDDQEEEAPNVRPRKVYQGGHTYNINSLSFSSDGETFLSSDDLRINMWNTEINHQAFSTVDIKPANMDDLQEVITCATFHPTQCNNFIYSTTKGCLRLCDLRQSAICDRNAKEYVDPNKGAIDFFSELVSTISDVQFSPNGYFFASRNYLSIKLWDIRKETGPFKTIRIHDHLLPNLNELYENDSIFDKFQFAWSGDSLQVLTGSYSGNFYVCDTLSSDETITKVTLLKSNAGNYQGLDSSQKVLRCDWHPNQDIIAIGCKDYGYLYLRKEDDEDEDDLSDVDDQ